jgi:RHS repeat-associated protein
VHFTYDALRLYHYGARQYSHLLSRFITPDTIVPGANPQALNRYSYVLNNPLNMVDPSGHDPLDANWEEQFRRRNNGWSPSDADRQNRLFSLLFPGQDPSGVWTASDWALFFANRDRYMSGDWPWPWGDTRAGLPEQWGSLSAFASRLNTLSTYYNPGEESQFIGAIGLLWAGVPYSPHPQDALRIMTRPGQPSAGGDRMQYLLSETWGGAGFNPLFVEPAWPGIGNDPTHHYAMHLWMGYHTGAVDSTVATLYRDMTVPDWPVIRQFNATRHDTDVHIGVAGAVIGELLRRGLVGIDTLGTLTWQTLRTP